MQVDWSFSAAPEGPGTDAASPPPARPTPPPPRRPLPWRWLAALAGLALLAALGAWLFTRLGLLRLQAQLAAQVVYEDQRAQAGDVPALLAVQAANQPYWDNQLTAYARLGLAAPLPAGDLRPAGTPPRLAHLDLLSSDLFAATVTRDYLDPAGQTVAFDLVQWYRNTGPGAWERLAPTPLGLPPFTSDERQSPALPAPSLFVGQRLSVTVPAADLPWLGPALLQADDLIVQACADWADTCPPGHRLLAAFGAAPELTTPSRFAQDGSPRAGTDSHWPAPLPRIFWLSPGSLANNLALNTLAAPLLAGRPHDAPAQAALARSLSAQLLGLYAGDLAGPARLSDDYFLDALVARAEVRHLGADATPQPLAPQDYIDLQTLWQAAGAGLGQTGWRTDLAWRREAFDFLNAALAGQPPAVDGRLLHTLRSTEGAGLDDWLAGVLGAPARSWRNDWDSKTVDAFARRMVTNWKPYIGLTLACADAVYQVHDSAEPLEFRGSLPSVPAGSLLVGDLSPNGRYLPLSLATNSTSPQSSLEVMDLNAAALAAVSSAPAVPFGWSAAGDLLYTLSDVPNTGANSPNAQALRSYDPASFTSRLLIADRVSPFASGRLLWSADHSALLVALVDQTSTQFTLAWGLLTFTPTVQVRRLPLVGDEAGLSPDGTQVAYVRFGDPASPSGSAAQDASPVRLEVLDLTTSAIRRLAATNDLTLPPGLMRFLYPLWSADGQQVMWMAYTDKDATSYLLSAPAAGGAVRVWGGSGPQLFLGGFSADGRYLLAGHQPDPRLPAPFWLFNQQAPGVPPPLVGAAISSVWAPTGHRLLLSGPAGVSSLDPATGDWEYLGMYPGCQLRW